MYMHWHACKLYIVYCYIYCTIIWGHQNERLISAKEYVGLVGFKPEYIGLQSLLIEIFTDRDIIADFFFRESVVKARPSSQLIRRKNINIITCLQRKHDSIYSYGESHHNIYNIFRLTIYDII